MQKQIEYKDKTIVVDTYKLDHGFQWSYQIDGGPPREGRDTPLPNEVLVLQEGIGAAKAEIDRAG